MAKKKTVTAIRIDAISGEVTQAEFPRGERKEDWRARMTAMYAAISMPGLRPCDGVDSVRIDQDGNYLYVDGEGLLKDPTHFLLWKGYPQALAGHALIVHNNAEGDMDDCLVKPEWVKAQVKLVKLKMLGYRRTTENVMMFGSPGVRIINTPVFTFRRTPGETPPTMDDFVAHIGLPRGKIDWAVIEHEDIETAPPEGDDEAHD
jgi:hypothetical protein